MRVFIFILHLILAYMLLSGWPENFAIWVRAGLALIVVMLVMPLNDVIRGVDTKVKLKSLRKLKWLDYLSIGLVIFSVELLLLSLFTLGPETAEEIHEEVKHWIISDEVAGNDEQDAPNELSYEGAGNWLWDNHFSRSHPVEAAKRPSNKPEVFMEVPDSASQIELQKNNIYLRTFALDKFDGDTWSIYRPSRLVIERSVSNALFLGGGIQITPAIARTELPIYEHTITQPYYSDGQNILTTLHHAIDVDVESVTKVSTDTFTLPKLLKSTNGNEEESYKYSARSQPMLLDVIIQFDEDIQVGRINDVYYSKVNNPSLQAKLTEFVAGVDKTLPLADVLTVIKQRINDQCSYSLDIKNDDGINPLENFLFVEKAGYCEFYASATAMLCRELGIPSRIAFGWSGGKFYEDSDLFVFLSKDAHAWAEVYLDGYGWVVFDTTPPAENAITESAEDEKPPEIDEVVNGDNEFDELEEDSRIISWYGVLYTMMGILILLVGILLSRRFTQEEQLSINSSYIKNEPKYLQAFQSLSTKLGCPYKTGSTLMHNVQMLKNKEINLQRLDDLLDEMLAYHYDSTYRNTPNDKTREIHFVKELKKMIKQVEG